MHYRYLADNIIDKQLDYDDSYEYLAEKMDDFQKDLNSDDFWECLHQDNSKIMSHPKSPINSMPLKSKLLHSISASNSICDTTMRKLRVILVLNRPSRSDLRQAIRETWSNFTIYSKSSLIGSYTKFFLVGSPNDEEEEFTIKTENEKYNDIVVANVPEGYYNTTLKILIGMKFVSCFCPNAEYFIKADDDDYLRIKFLDKVIEEEQLQLNQRVKEHNKNPNVIPIRLPARLYMGGCGVNKVQRPDPDHKVKNSWQIPVAEYSEDTYPPYCGGPLYMFSMPALHEIARDCPHTCIGLDPRDYEENIQKPCFWKFEDTFIGSCAFFTRNDTTRINIQYRSAVLTGYKYYKERVDQVKHVNVHGIRQYEHMIEAHEYYQERNLVY